MYNKFFSPLSFVAVFGSGMGKNQDPGYTFRIRNTASGQCVVEPEQQLFALVEA